MNFILREISTLHNWENQYTYYARKNLLNSLNSKLINQQNFENFQNFIQAIVQKGPRKSKKRWVSNQRRILHILLNCVSVINNQPVQEFKNPEILRIQRVFSYKDRYSIEYEIRKLSTNNKQNRRRWSQKQENFLQDIVKKTQNKNKWNQIAQQLFINSKGEYFRQGKHCRQRFFKLKDGKCQFSMSGEISSDEESEQQNSMKFHSHHSAKSSQKEGMEQEIQQNIRNQKIVKVNMSNQVDQICKKQKSSTRAEVLGTSNSKPMKGQKSRKKKQRSTQESLEGSKSHSHESIYHSKDHEKLNIENQGSIENKYPSVMNVEEKQNLESEKIQNGQQANQQMMMPQMGYNEMGMGINMNPMQQNVNGVMDQGWYNMMGYWPLGAFSFNFQGFY